MFPSSGLGPCKVFWQSPGIKVQIVKCDPAWEAPGRRAQGSGCLVAGWQGGCKQTGHNSPILAQSWSQEPASSHQCHPQAAIQCFCSSLCPLPGVGWLCWRAWAPGCWGCPAHAQLAPVRPCCPTLGRWRVTVTHHGPTSAGPSPGLTTALPRMPWHPHSPPQVTPGSSAFPLH